MANIKPEQVQPIRVKQTKQAGTGTIFLHKGRQSYPTAGAANDARLQYIAKEERVIAGTSVEADRSATRSRCDEPILAFDANVPTLKGDAKLLEPYHRPTKPEAVACPGKPLHWRVD